jgi:hypothetical protein
MPIYQNFTCHLKWSLLQMVSRMPADVYIMKRVDLVFTYRFVSVPWIHVMFYDVARIWREK